MSDKELYIRLFLLVINFMFLILADEKPLKLMSGIAFIMLFIGTIGELSL